MTQAVRTTIDLPEDVHTVATALARSRGQSLSRTVGELLRHVLIPEREIRVEFDEEIGLPVVHLPGTVTDEDVKALEDEF